MIGTVVPDCAGLRSRYRGAIVTAIVAAVFLLIVYGLVPQRPFLGFPFHHDDYNLQGMPQRPPLNAVRPVCFWVAYGLSRLAGGAGFYLAQNVFTLLYPLLVLWFLSVFCGRTITPLRAAAFAVIAFCTTAPFWSCKYSITSNHASGLFGVGAMLVLHHAQLNRRWDWLAGGTILFVLSVFAKEDFALAVLLLGFYHVVDPRFRRPVALVQFALLLAVCAAVWAYGHWIAPNPFTNSDSDPTAHYFVNLAPSSVFRLLLRYLAFALPSLPLQIVAGAAAVGGVFTARRLEFATVTAITLALVAPYTVLPNHVFDFYTINWSPWLAGLIVVVPPPLGLTGWRPESPLRRTAAVVQVAAVGIGLVVVLWQTQEPRVAVGTWIQNQQQHNQHMVKQLVRNRNQFAGQPTVGVVGVKGFSPWLINSGWYLARLGFTQRWVVFVHLDEALYNTQMEPDHTLPPGKLIYVQPLAALRDYPDLPCLCFDDSGNLTRVVRAAELQPPGVDAEAEPHRKFADSSDVRLSLSDPGTSAGIEGNARVTMAPGPEGLVVQASGDGPNLTLPAFAYDPQTTLLVRVDLTSPADMHLDLRYQTSRAPEYEEARKVSQLLHKGRNVVYLPVTTPGLAGRLRLDPGTVAGPYVLHSVEVRALPR
jgi:hypothetical protein